jgi:hypothetical protein
VSKLVLSGDTSGSVTLDAPAVSGTTTLTLPTTSATLLTDSSGVLNIGSGQVYKDASGNVGIGTTAPATKITINNNTVLPSAGPPSSGSSIWTVGGDSVASGLSFDSFAIQTNFITRRANGTAASPTALATGNNIFQFAARGYGATGYSTAGRAQFSFLAGENWTDTAQGTYITFSTTTNGTATALERMRIDDAGNLLFNSGYGSVATAYGCRAWVNFNGTGTVAIRGSGNVTSITDLGTGYYQINFTTAITDANYCVNVTGSVATSSSTPVPAVATNTAPATSNVRITFNIAGTGQVDQLYTSVAVFR